MESNALPVFERRDALEQVQFAFKTACRCVDAFGAENVAARYFINRNACEAYCHSLPRPGYLGVGSVYLDAADSSFPAGWEHDPFVSGAQFSSIGRAGDHRSKA